MRRIDFFERLAQRAVQPPRVLPRLASRFELRPEPFAPATSTTPATEPSSLEVGPLAPRERSEPVAPSSRAEPAPRARRELEGAPVWAPSTPLLGVLSESPQTFDRISPPIRGAALDPVLQPSGWGTATTLETAESARPPSHGVIVSQASPRPATASSISADRPPALPRIERERITSSVVSQQAVGGRDDAESPQPIPPQSAWQPAAPALPTAPVTAALAPLEITIGRIEVIAMPAEPTRRAPHEAVAPAPPQLPLDRYLQQRGGRGR